MSLRKKAIAASSLFALFVVLGVAVLTVDQNVTAQAQVNTLTNADDLVPIYEVDPSWPNVPLPNNWVIGNVIGVDVDDNDNVWMIHRPAALTNNEIPLYHNPPTGVDCCMPAPPVLVFNAAGDLINSFGPLVAGGEFWADAEHGMFVDHTGSMWTGGGGTGNSAADSALFKFAVDGSLLQTIGQKGLAYDSNSRDSLGAPADIWIEEEDDEIWVADGYGNRRVIVFDYDSGRYKRHFGAYGNRPEDTATVYNPDSPPSDQFRPPVHCVVISDDDFVYICDRGNDRIQVFRKNGEFVFERFIAKATTSAGSVWDIEFSNDPEQKFVFLVDGINHRVRVLRRSDLIQVSEFGHQGRWAGGFYAAHSIGIDSNSNIYIGETWEGKRVQKFTYKGLGLPTR
jgi:hypothetical protein